MKSAPFLVEVSEAEIRRERQKARELRASQWWKRLAAGFTAITAAANFRHGS
jgi:hypothetical protein